MIFSHLKRKHWKEFDVTEYDRDIYPIPLIKKEHLYGYPYGWNKSKNNFIDNIDKKKFPSASNWTSGIVQAIHCLVVNCNEEEVIPKLPQGKMFSYDFPPSMIELLELDINKMDLQNKNWRNKFIKEPHPLVAAFLVSLRKQIKERFNIGEDKRETYTDKWVTDLLRCLGCDSFKGRFHINPSEEYSFQVAESTCKAILDIRVDDDDLDILCWFDESKRLNPHHTPHEHHIKSQKVAETLAFANELRDIAKGRDIEVFCISAHHTFVNFSHTIVPIAYLDYMAEKGIQELDDPDASIVHKIHTKRSLDNSIPNGYDITDYNDRKFIIKALWNTFGYIATEGIFR